MSLPELVHFHSQFTGISLELPAGWKVEAERPGEAIYASASQDGFPVTPKLIIKSFTVPDDPEAWRVIADQMGGGEGRQLLSSRQITLSGVPAQLDSISYDAPSLGQRLFHMQVFCQVGALVFSISGIAGWAQQSGCRPLFEAALDSVRFAGGPLAQPPAGSPFYHPGLSLSLALPAGWTAEDVAGKPMVRLFSQPYPDLGDYRCSLSFLMGQPAAPPGHSLRELSAARRAEQAHHHPQFTLISQETFTLSCRAQVDLYQFSWYHRPTSMDIHQLSALILTGGGTVYTISGAALQPLAAHCAPQFEGILRSVRVLPPAA